MSQMHSPEIPSVVEDGERAGQLGWDLSTGIPGELACAGVELIPHTEGVDVVSEIEDLERRYEALECIRSRYALQGLTPLQRALAPLVRPMHYVEEIGNQFASKILPAYMHDDPATGLELFRSVQPHTTQEEMVLLVSDSQFGEIHGAVKEHLKRKAPDIEAAVEARVNPVDGQISINDRLQFRGTETASSLENILRNGVILSLEAEAVGALKTVASEAGESSIPITEQVKNLRLITINGFRGSKISHAVHDAVDHAWTFELLRTKGLLEEYRDLLQSIGNPHLTNIFFREGEAIASISFGVRYWSMIEPGFKPATSIQDIANKMDEHFDAGQLSDERHIRAYRIIRKLIKDPSVREAQCLAFTFSNYITELNEQRRKHGKIKQKDLATGSIKSELDPFSADFLSLFIETHHEILKSENRHRNDLFVFHILLEEYLRDVGNGKLPEDAQLNVRIPDLRTVDVTQTTLPASRLHWMFRNHGFTSTKDSVY
jgi:hypothetical protein